ncbi:MAG: 5'-nucleotidase, lipoprotein e(P4) family [Owenweeksia sp.]
MKRLKPFVALLIILVACKSPEEPKEVRENYSDDLVNATLWYQTSDEMKAQYRQAYHHAGELLLKYHRELETGVPSAVILDVDETVLDNSPYEARLIQNGESYNPESWAQWVREAVAMPLPGALEFTLMADSLDVDVFYITNRDIRLLEPTLKNLKEKGFPVAEEGHLLLKEKTSNKTERRNKVKEHFNVLLLVGDQLTDFAEEIPFDSDTVRDHFIMLPNPMYGSFLDKAYQGDFSIPESEKAARRRAALKTGTK